MNIILNLLPSFVFLVLSVLPTSADELATRTEIDARARSFLIAGEFAALEQMASEFRDEKARTSSGLHKLDLFYFGVFDAADFAISRYFDDEQDLLDLADGWVEAYPDSVTAVISRAIILRSLGWHYRGGGAISSVSRNDLQEFRRYIELANQGLLAVEDFASSDSYWYYLRARFMMETNVVHQDFLALLLDGLSRHPEA